MTPLVSVIVPVYNTAPYLRQCLDSIVNQTLKEIEIICVDDGSIDESLKILKEYSVKDSRILILQQENKGGGAARNYGMSVASGEYLSFLDADDTFDKIMLEKIYSHCKKLNLDIGIFNYYYYNVQTCEKNLSSEICECHLPEKEIFSFHDMSKHILTDLSSAAWNKLYKREFVVANNLKFHEIFRTNDLFFVRLSLILADKISVLNEPLMNYHIGMFGNCQATNYHHPFDMYETLQLLRKTLSELDVFEEVKQSFLNLALWITTANVLSLEQNRAVQEILYTFLKTEGFISLGLSRKTVRYSLVYNKYYCFLYQIISSLSYSEYCMGKRNLHYVWLAMCFSIVKVIDRLSERF
ncbi:MAG TPA: glycosyltransferase family 2 protein [Methanocorpusculum sp.]|nr:glycosyltransferase family 2 protein [Methanocorpusculum sp.]